MPAPTNDAPDPRAVLDAFGLTGGVLSYEPVAGGWSNRVLRLRTADHDLAVKEILNPWGVPTWRRWLAEGWRLERAALAASIRGAEPLVADDGGCLVEVPRGDAPAHVRAHRWVEARAVPAGPVDRSVARWAGEALARVHALALRPQEADLYDGTATSAALAAWPDLVARSEQAAAPWTAALRDAEPALARAAALLEPRDDATAVLVHGDLDQRNLLVDDAGPLLLDWDVVMPSDPGHDLARTALVLADWRAPDVARAVLDAYASATGHPVHVEPADLAPALDARFGWARFSIDRALAGGAQAVSSAAHDVATILKNAVRRVEVTEQVDAWLEGRAPV